MFYLIGLGLNSESLSLEAFKKIRKVEKIFLEGYTVDFPYKIKELESVIGKSIVILRREDVEGEKFLEEAKEKEIVLFVYGDCLAATTHISLILKCKKEKIPYEILHNASVLNAITNSGLQWYKFGKTASMPAWKKSYEPDSFLDILKENTEIGAHTIILVDISLEFDKAFEQLKKACENKKIKISELIVASCLGTKQEKFFYGKIKDFHLFDAKLPFCFIIPGKMHFVEKEALEVLCEAP